MPLAICFTKSGFVLLALDILSNQIILAHPIVVQPSLGPSVPLEFEPTRGGLIIQCGRYITCRKTSLKISHKVISGGEQLPWPSGLRRET